MTPGPTRLPGAPRVVGEEPRSGEETDSCPGTPADPTMGGNGCRCDNEDAPSGPQMISVIVK